MMRIQALRASDVKRFTSPVQIAGFGAGLNVLSGPNEFGKSTLLAALQAVLFADHKSVRDDIKKLQPNAGGTPLIEVDFEAGGRQWRLRKQFLSRRMAVLTELATGATLKNDDAEARLATLLQGPPDLERFKLLWVRQGGTLVDLAPEAAGGGLAALIAGEVDAVALDANARAIHAKVRKELSTLQTLKTARPTGRWSDAQLERKNTADALAVAEGKVVAQTARLERFAEAAAAKAHLTAPAAMAARANAVAAAQANVARAQEATRQRDAAALTLRAAQAALQAAEREHTAVLAAVTEATRLEIEAATSASAAAGLRGKQSAAATGLERAQAEFVRAAGQVTALEAAFAAAQKAARAAEAAEARDKLAATISAARETAAQKARAAAEVAARASITEARVKSLRDAISALATLDGAFAAVVPEVTIELLSGAAGRINVDGRALAASATLRPDAPLTLEIAGVGRITIAPNPATISASQRAAREAKRAEVTQGHSALGSATLADAEARLAQRQAAEATVRECEAKLAVQAPGGIDALVAIHAGLAQQSANVPAAPSGAHVVVTESDLAAAREAREAAAGAVRAAETAIGRLREDTASHEATAMARAQRQAAIVAQWGDALQQNRARAAAGEILSAAQSTFTAAQSAADAWNRNADSGQHEFYSQGLAAAEAAQAKAIAELGALEQTISGLRGELSVAGDDDIEAGLARAQQHATAATSALDDIAAEVEALRLLDTEFGAIAEAGRTQLSAPILQRVAPYLTQVFHGGAIELGGDLVPSGLLRDGRRDAHEQLSDGTKEQIAILVRLGLARLLADKGAAVPLLLDDALVFADDRRLVQMFAALRTAAAAHQVIVLNCREQTFAALAQAPGATQLRLEAWTPD